MTQGHGGCIQLDMLLAVEGGGAEGFGPRVVGGAGAEAPGVGAGVGEPVEGFDAAGLAAGEGELEGVFEGDADFAGGEGGIDGDEERAAGAGDEVEPLAIFIPGGFFGVGCAVGIGGEEGVVLGKAESEGVDAHAAGAFPDAAGGVVAGALDFEEPRAEVADGVAAEEVGVGGGVAEGAVEAEDDFGIGEGGVAVAPLAAAGAGAHLEAPLAEGVIGGEIVFDEFVTPVAEPGDVIGDAGEIFGEGKIEGRFGFAAGVAGAEACGIVDGGEGGGPDPDAGAYAKGFDACGEGGHIGEGVWAAGGPGSAGADAAGGPAGIDGAEGSIGMRAGEFGEEGGVALDGLGLEAFAVGVVPIVISGDGSAGEAGVRAHDLAEPASDGEGGFAGPSAGGDDGGGVEFARAEVDGAGAVA